MIELFASALECHPDYGEHNPDYGNSSTIKLCRGRSEGAPATATAAERTTAYDVGIMKKSTSLAINPLLWVGD